jgi:hypothetical protein
MLRRTERNKLYLPLHAGSQQAADQTDSILWMLGRGNKTIIELSVILSSFPACKPPTSVQEVYVNNSAVTSERYFELKFFFSCV